MLGQIWANSWFCNQRHVDFWGSPALKQALVSEHFPYQACTFNDGVFTRQQLTLTNIPEGQMDGRLCRHGWNKAFATFLSSLGCCIPSFQSMCHWLPAAKLHFAVCSGRSEVQVSSDTSKIGGWISADISDHHGHISILTVRSAALRSHESSMNVKLSGQTSSFVIRAVEMFYRALCFPLFWFYGRAFGSRPASVPGTI